MPAAGVELIAVSKRHGAVTAVDAIALRIPAGGVAVGSGAIIGFPTIWAQNIKNITLR
jgi:hypothetical protein